MDTIIDETKERKKYNDTEKSIGMAGFLTGILIGIVIVAIMFAVVKISNNDEQYTYDNVEPEMHYSTISDKLYIPETPDNNSYFFIMADGNILLVEETNYKHFYIGQGYVYSIDFVIGHI